MDMCKIGAHLLPGPRRSQVESHCLGSGGVLNLVLFNLAGWGAAVKKPTWVLAFVSLLFVSFIPSIGAAQVVSSADATTVSGPWHGRWTAPEGWIYEATMRLQLTGAGSVSGEINWTLRKSPRPNEANKIGQAGIEKVRGTYYPNSGTLTLEGYDKVDPSGILGLDKYRLVISDDHRRLGGITSHHNSWTGQFLLARESGAQSKK